jgi:hypothetical protein
MNNSEEVEEATILLEWCHVGIYGLYIVYALILFVWPWFALIEHFSDQLFHISFWLAFEILHVVICVMSLAYETSIVNNKVVVETDRNIDWSKACIFIISCILIKNIVHIVFVSMELVNKTSPLAIDSYWFLAAFVTMLACLVVMNIGAIIMFYWYKRYLGLYAYTMKKRKNK